MSHAQGRGTLVLDPLHDVWDCSYKTDSVEDFLRTFWASQNCDAFIDESGDTIGHFDRAMIQTATKGRHWGHNMHYITQRPAQISPTVRTQCKLLFLFAIAREDAEVLAREWNKPELREACKLPAGVCFATSRFGGIKKVNVFE